MERRLALLIGNTAYQDTGLQRLTAPEGDVQALAAVLRDPAVGAFDEITTLFNPTFAQVYPAIAEFFGDKLPSDTLLLYFSGHGLLDDQGRLYLALNDTRLARRSGTALPANYVKDEMDRSRSKRQIVLLDCCHSGAMGKGAKGSAGSPAILNETFASQGYERVVLTASDKTEMAWEADPEGAAAAERSVFTQYVVEGLLSGNADADNDGVITPNELYEYVYEQVVRATPKQKPQCFVYERGGELHLARSVRPTTQPLPAELTEALASQFVVTREYAVKELARLLTSRDRARAAAARAALESIATTDDSLRLRSLAAAALKVGPPAPPAAPPPVMVEPAPSAPEAATSAPPEVDEPVAPVAAHPTPPVSTAKPSAAPNVSEPVAPKPTVTPSVARAVSVAATPPQASEPAPTLKGNEAITSTQPRPSVPAAKPTSSPATAPKPNIAAPVQPKPGAAAPSSAPQSSAPTARPTPAAAPPGARKPEPSAAAAHAATPVAKPSQPVTTNAPTRAAAATPAPDPLVSLALTLLNFGASVGLLAITFAIGYLITLYLDSDGSHDLISALVGGAVSGVGAYLAVCRPLRSFRVSALLLSWAFWAGAQLAAIRIFHSGDAFGYVIWFSAVCLAGGLTTQLGLSAIGWERPVRAWPWRAVVISTVGWGLATLLAIGLAILSTYALNVASSYQAGLVLGFLLGGLGGVVMLWQLQRVRTQVARMLTTGSQPRKPLAPADWGRELFVRPTDAERAGDAAGQPAAQTPAPVGVQSPFGFWGSVLSLAVAWAIGSAVSYYHDPTAIEAYGLGLIGSAIIGLGIYLVLWRPYRPLNAGILFLACAMAFGNFLADLNLRNDGSIFAYLIWVLAEFLGGGLMAVFGLRAIQARQQLQRWPWGVVLGSAVAWGLALLISVFITNTIMTLFSSYEYVAHFAFSGFLIGAMGGTVLLWQLNRVRAQLAK